MELYLFDSFLFAGIILYAIGLFCGKESLFIVGLSLWIIGLIGNVVVFVSRANIEEQEPCRCESCCCVKIERYE